MTKYKRLTDGEGDPVSTETTLKSACCDCGLVHIIQFFKTEQGLDMVAWRNNRATAQLRRHNYGNLQSEDSGKYKMVKKER